MPERAVLELLGPSTGGIRRHVGQLATSLPALGWRVAVAGPAALEAGSDLPALLPVPVPLGSNPTAVPRAVAALRRHARDVDLIHAHGLKAGWVAVLARTGTPIVLTVHNLVLDEAAGRAARLLRRIEGRLPRHVQGLIAVSEEIGARFGGPADGLWVVPPAGPLPIARRPAAEVRRALGVERDAPLVVSVARLHPQKDLRTLISATEVLRRSVPDVRVVIVGEGPLERELQQMMDIHGLRGCVTLAGPSANAADEMAAADVIVVSSSWESGPLVASEALLLERPLVSTPVGFVPRLASMVDAIKLVAVGDAVEMAGAIERALVERSRSTMTAEATRQRVLELLGPDRLVAEVAAVYDVVLARAGASR
ncbi:MAG: glycosyltransferase family 4 protein [Microthrixaceae bacterium]